MENSYIQNLPQMYLCSFVFGIVCAGLYDVLWALRVSLLNNRFVWLTDILATSSAGIFISVLQYNFSSGKFRLLPFLFFFFGLMAMRLTFSRALRFVIDKIISLISSYILSKKIRLFSCYRRYYLLRLSSRGFGLLKKTKIK